MSNDSHRVTKARRYYTTFPVIRTTRVAYRRQQDQADPAEHLGPSAAAGELDQAATVTIGALTYAGAGWHTLGDALLANSAAAQARDRRRIGREEVASGPTATFGDDALRAA